MSHDDNTLNGAGYRILDFVKFCIIPGISNRLDKSHEMQFKIFNKLHVAPSIFSNVSKVGNELSRSIWHSFSFNVVSSIDHSAVKQTHSLAFKYE